MKLSWTQEIFDCGFKFTYVSLSSHFENYAAVFLTLIIGSLSSILKFANSFSSYYSQNYSGILGAALGTEDQAPSTFK